MPTEMSTKSEGGRILELSVEFGLFDLIGSLSACGIQGETDGRAEFIVALIKKRPRGGRDSLRLRIDDSLFVLFGGVKCASSTEEDFCCLAVWQLRSVSKKVYHFQY